jgi:prefoldin subunit 5
VEARSNEIKEMRKWLKSMEKDSNTLVPPTLQEGSCRVPLLLTLLVEARSNEIKEMRKWLKSMEKDSNTLVPVEILGNFQIKT